MIVMVAVDVPCGSKNLTVSTATAMLLSMDRRAMD